MATCRDCPAEVIFVPSAKTGKPMILDAKPAKAVVLWDTFNAEIPERSGSALSDMKFRDQLVARVVDVFTDHHATCPKAADWKGQTRDTRKGTIHLPISPVVLGDEPTRGHGRGVQ